MNLTGNISYFMYSRKSEENEKSIYEKMRKLYREKKVLYLGKWYTYTHITTKPDEIKKLFADAVVVAKGELEYMKTM